MFGILVSAFYTILRWLVSQLVVKFVVLFALFFVVQAFVAVLAAFIPTPASLTSALSGVPAGIWFFMDLFAFTQGVPLVVTAIVYRFLIRRIPVIG